MMRSGARPVFVMEVDDGTNQWYAQTEMMGDNIDYDPSIVNIDPISAKYDPRTKKVQMSRLTVTVVGGASGDALWRDIIAANRLKGAKVEVLFGPAESSFTDFSTNDLQPYFGGIFDDFKVDPEGQLIDLEILDIWTAIDDVKTVGVWFDQHPLEIALDILDNRVGLDSSLRDATTFDPSDAANANNSHLNVWRCAAPSSYYIDNPVTSPTSSFQLVQELLQIVDGVLVPDETGKLAVKIFDSTAASVRDWTDDEVIELRQEEVGSTIFNRVLSACSGTGQPWFHSKAGVWVIPSDNFYVATDEDSLATYAGPVASEGAIDEVIENIWIMGGAGYVQQPIQLDDTSMRITGGLGWCGFRDLIPPGSQPADAKPSASRPVYILLRRADNLGVWECVKITSQCTPVNSGITRMPYFDPYLEAHTAKDVVDTFDANVARAQLEIGLSYTISSIANAGGGDIRVTTTAAHQLVVGQMVTHTRCTDSAYNGEFAVQAVPSGTTYDVTAVYTATDTGKVTVARPFPKYSEAVDITAAKFIADPLLDRYSDGAPEIEVDTPLSEFAVQLGDLVTVTNSNYLSFGLDGIDTSTKWEVVGKEVVAFDDEPKITWTLVRATIGSPTRGHGIRKDDMARPQKKAGRAAIERYNSQFRVVDGLTAAIASGFDVTISLGRLASALDEVMIGGDVTITVNASKDTYVYIDTTTGKIVLREVALGGTQPTTDEGRVLIAKVVSDGAGATSVTNLKTEQTGAVGSQGLTLTDPNDAGECPNGMFGDW